MDNIPSLGFGTYRLKEKVAFISTVHALKTGYNHIDTANLYKNEAEIGKAIKECDIKRKDLWLTTKVQVKDIKKGRDGIYKSIMNSLTQLDTEYLDLVLLHGPIPNMIVESWKILEDIVLNELYDRVRFIGISNYDIVHLEQLLPTCRIRPYANQFEISPYLNRDKLVEFCKLNGIVPVAHTSLVKGERFNDEKLERLSEKTGLSKSLLLLGWALHHGLTVLPRSSNPDHINENMVCVAIKLDPAIIDELNKFHIIDTHITHPQYLIIP